MLFEQKPQKGSPRFSSPQSAEQQQLNYSPAVPPIGICASAPARGAGLDQHTVELMSHWADGIQPGHQPPARKPAARSEQSKRPHRPALRNGFDRLTNGKHGFAVSERNAPERIVLPTQLLEGMQTGWNQSMPMGEPQEHGGFLVRNRDGSRKWLPGEPGSSRQFNPEYGDVSRYQTILAVGHTHPYDEQKADERGGTDSPFSGEDLAAHIWERERLGVVQTENRLFVSARSREFEERLEKMDGAERLALEVEMQKFWQTMFEAGTRTLRENAEAATWATAHRYHILYYAGTKKGLQKIDTSCNR